MIVAEGLSAGPALRREEVILTTPREGTDLANTQHISFYFSKNKKLKTQKSFE